MRAHNTTVTVALQVSHLAGRVRDHSAARCADLRLVGALVVRTLQYAAGRQRLADVTLRVLGRVEQETDDGRR
jgi:hypothetical protein